jgi:hypothetical protein
LWRAYQELLLGHERRSHGGVGYDPAKLAGELKTNVQSLESLLANQPLPPAIGKSEIISRVADAQRRFFDKLKADGLSQSVKDQRVDRYLALVRVKNELVFRATDYVRWHATTMRNSPRRHRLYQPIVDFLTGLRALVDRLDSCESEASVPSASTQVEETLDGLDLQAQTLKTLRKAIEEEGLYKDAADLIDRATKNPETRGIAGPIGSLLATPLLPAPLRMKLLRARIGLRQPFDTGSRSADGKPQPPARWTLDGRQSAVTST